MKNIMISLMVLTMGIIFAGCRGSNSTYTTESVATTVETQASTPTINNGNGPITTAPTATNETASTAATGTEGLENTDSTTEMNNTNLTTPIGETAK